MNNKIISFNALAFLKDNRIDHTTTGQKATKNRVQVHCPFCIGSKKYHLGIHLSDAYANCWRCGPHSILKVVKELLHVSWSETYKIIEQYGDVSSVKIQKHDRVHASEVVLPDLLEPLKTAHAKYLIGRGFTPEGLVNTWGIQSTGPAGDYKHRIFIPIYYRNRVVSFQCRSISTNENVVRYLTCPPEKEAIFHKSILYGIDNVISDTIVVVEGVTDAWKLGAGAVATFGINYMKEQVYQISRYKNVYIMFDPEKTAQRMAEKLGNELAFMNNCNVNILDIKDTGVEDPGSLPQKEAEQIMFEILTGRFNS